MTVKLLDNNWELNQLKHIKFFDTEYEIMDSLLFFFEGAGRTYNNRLTFHFCIRNQILIK